MRWEQIQRQVDEDVDAHTSDEHIRLLFNDGRVVPVLGTYNTSETIVSDGAGGTYYGIEQYVSISNRYLPQDGLPDKLRVLRKDMTGPKPVWRRYKVLRPVNLRVGRTRLVLQEDIDNTPVVKARWSPDETRIDGPEYTRWPG